MGDQHRALKIRFQKILCSNLHRTFRIYKSLPASVGTCLLRKCVMGFNGLFVYCWDDGGGLQFEDVKYKVEMKATADAAHAGAIGSLLHCSLSCVGLKKTVTKVRHSPPEKFILNGITASVAPGQMLALMGPSGSGKTTLLNALAGRLHKNLSGTISFNGLSFSSSLKRRWRQAHNERERERERALQCHQLSSFVSCLDCLVRKQVSHPIISGDQFFGFLCVGWDLSHKMIWCSPCSPCGNRCSSRLFCDYPIPWPGSRRSSVQTLCSRSLAWKGDWRKPIISLDGNSIGL